MYIIEVFDGAKKLDSKVAISFSQAKSEVLAFIKKHNLCVENKLIRSKNGIYKTEVCQDKYIIIR